MHPHGTMPFQAEAFHTRAQDGSGCRPFSRDDAALRGPSLALLPLLYLPFNVAAAENNQHQTINISHQGPPKQFLNTSKSISGLATCCQSFRN